MSEADELREFQAAVRARCLVQHSGEIAEGVPSHLAHEEPRYRCERCLGLFRTIEAHHIVPRGRGGNHDPRNGAGLCFSCHEGLHAYRFDDTRDWLKTMHEAAREYRNAD